MIKTRQDLIKEYLKFFKSEGHKEIPSSSIVPENDPTVLFTTAGMHPLVPYLTGQSHPLGKRLVNVQKCIRTGDIDEVGDPTHHTFFEMLGNWSLGDYWKREAIGYTFEFITAILKIPKEKLAATCFKGNDKAPKDAESAEILSSLGIPKNHITFLGKKENWWGPAGKTGPCGPDTEIFYWSHHGPISKNFDPANKHWVEIGNNVLMEYFKDKKENYLLAEQKNIDFGGGVERTLAILNNLKDNYLSPTFLPIIKSIETISKKKYESDKKNKVSMRIIADHIKAAIIILADDHQIKPSNIERGYVLRRLIRRAIRHALLIGIKENFTTKLFESVASIYPDYPELKKNKNFILTQLDEEENRFRTTLERGLKKFEKLTLHKKSLTGKETFLLFQSYGFPIEMTEELCSENGIKMSIKEFNHELKKHQELSRTASAGTFKSGLADNSEKTTRLHTATHLLNEALRIVLSKEVKQRGSNITPERTRFDFSFPRKLTLEEVKKVENLVNKKIKESLEVTREELPLKKAFASGAQGEFGHKYPDIVSVYTVVDKTDKRGFFSKEICTGPHVKNTKEIGHFKIIKETSVSAGVRRIKAVILDTES